MVLYLFYGLSLLAGLAARAQSGAAITGKAEDDKHEPVPFATVSLLSLTDSSLVRGAISDTAGRFELMSVPVGEYVVKISSVGYATFVSARIPIADMNTKTVELGTLAIRSDARTLSEVFVKGERPVMERSLGKLTLNVTNSFFKTATDALDVMRRVPGLRVDQMGGITLRGGVAPVVYIDGKQQPLTADELRNLSPDDIDQIEILPNASAQYDGETRAVINIKLKRDKTLGWKGSAYARYSVNRLYSGYAGGASATLKTKRMSWYGRVGYGVSNNFLTMKSRRIVRDAESITTFDGNSLIHYPGKPLSYQLSADYSIAKNHTVGVMAKGTLGRNNEITSDQTTITTANLTGVVTNVQQLITENRAPSRQTDAALDLNYSGKLNERGDQLTTNLDYAHYGTSKSQALSSYYTDAEGYGLGNALSLFGQFPATIDIRSARTDFTHPFGNKAKLELGFKYSYTHTDNELLYDTLGLNGEHTRDLSRSNRFVYDEHITAGYGQYSQEIGRFSYNLGMRLEQTSAVGNSITLNQVVHRNYLRWLPTVQFLYRINDNQTLTVGYSRKMTRPSFYDLNPFQLYVNKYLYTEGNPFLLPIRRNLTEVAYTYKNISATLSYQLDLDPFQQMPVQDVNTNILHYTRVNLDMYRALTLDLAASHSIRKWWKIQQNVSIFYNQTKSVYLGGLINNRLTSYYLRGQQVFSLASGFALNLDYEYVSPTASQIYRAMSYGTVSVGLQKSILQGLGTIQINVGDIFNSYRENFYGQYQDINLSTQQKRNVQQGSIRFTYNFGKSTYKQKNKVSGSAEEESRAR